MYKIISTALSRPLAYTLVKQPAITALSRPLAYTLVEKPAVTALSRPWPIF